MLIKSEIVKTSVADVWINDDGILYVKIFEGAEISDDDARELFDAYEKLVCRKNKVLQILDARVDCTITPEGRQVSLKYSKDFLIASAVISSSLAIKLIVNFFNNFLKYDVPLKIFSTEEEGLKWLSGFRK